jgi:4'-phosphopantetheinyl transferase
MIPSHILVCILRADGSRTTDEVVLELAQQHLGENVGEIVRSERGKPSFPQRQNLFFSISHSGEYFVCAFAPCEIGIDLQEIKHLRSETTESASPRFKKMAARFFHPDEAEYVDSDTYFRFFRVWTAKEAYVKLTGQGIDNDFSSLSVLDEGQALPEMQSGEAAWRASGAYFTQMQVAQGYSFCICSREERKIEVLYL